MPALLGTLWRRRPRLAFDEIRLPAQTAAAVILAYLAALAAGASDVSWAVFSALFVVQATVGGTIGTALDRMLGALVGAALGVAAVFVFGNGGWHTVAALAAGVITMSFVVLRWPSLSYGLVTVAILAVAPDPYLVEGALEKALAIVLGSCCGMLAGIAVFPVAAARSADRQLSSAVRGLGRLLAACAGTIGGREGEDRAPIHAAIEGALRRARELAWSARFERPARSVDRRLADTVLFGIERFWYSLAMIDRVSAEPAPPDVVRWLGGPVDALAEAVGEHLGELADAIEGCREAPAADAVRERYDAFAQALEEALGEGALERREREYAIGLKWAWSLAVRHTEELTDGVNRAIGQS